MTVERSWVASCNLELLDGIEHVTVHLPTLHNIIRKSQKLQHNVKHHLAPLKMKGQNELSYTWNNILMSSLCTFAICKLGSSYPFQCQIPWTHAGWQDSEFMQYKSGSFLISTLPTLHIGNLHHFNSQTLQFLGYPNVTLHRSNCWNTLQGSRRTTQTSA